MMLSENRTALPLTAVCNSTVMQMLHVGQAHPTTTAVEVRAPHTITVQYPLL